MQKFTGYQYLLIDVANAYGHDKLVFEDRIKWTEDNLKQLESLADKADSKPLFMKAVMAIRKAQKGVATGHLVGFDAVCSGVQIMSALTGCEAGAAATGLIDTGERPDAYTSTTKVMNGLLASQGISLNVSRPDAKAALMTSCYGSKRKPKEIFGEGTPELAAFYEAVQIVAPGAWELLTVLLESWQPYELFHTWQLPDGFQAKVKVMVRKEARVEVDELDHSTFTYAFMVNEGEKKGLSNVANIVHSIDAYVLRSIHRRCNYDPLMVTAALNNLRSEQQLRTQNQSEESNNAWFQGSKINYYKGLYGRSGMADVVILPYLMTTDACEHLSDDHIEDLIQIAEVMLTHKPFEVVTIHDEFKCHPNNMNQLRYWYKEILAELAESEVLSDILSQIHGVTGKYEKKSTNLAAQIRNSNYALC